MAAVTAQDSHDTNVWNTYDSWEAAKNVVFSIDTDSETTTTINSNYADLGVNSSNWQSKFTSGTTQGSVMYAQTVTAPMTVKGSIAVSFSALADNMPDASDTDLPIEERDALMVSAMLVDIAPEGKTFPAFNTSGSYVPKTTLAEGGAWMGGGLPNYDLKELNASDVTYKAAGWISATLMPALIPTPHPPEWLWTARPIRITPFTSSPPSMRWRQAIRWRWSSMPMNPAWPDIPRTIRSPLTTARFLRISP